MLVTLSGIVMEVSAPGPWNIALEIVVNLEPASNVIEVILLVCWKALTPIVITLAGMVMESKLVAPRNA